MLPVNMTRNQDGSLPPLPTAFVFEYRVGIIQQTRWAPFPPEMNAILSKALLDPKYAGPVTVILDDRPHKFDMLRMVQICHNGRQRAFRFRVQGAEDDNGGWVMPPVAVAHAGFASLPQPPWLVEDGIETPLDPVADHEPMYKALAAAFDVQLPESSSRHVLVQIHAVCGDQWTLKQEALTRYHAYLVGQRSQELQVHQLWHGTSPEAALSIARRGFLLMDTPRNGRVYGQGGYFAPTSAPGIAAAYTVPDDAGLRHVFLCDVVVGTVEECRTADRTGPTSDEYDNAVDSVQRPRRIIVWAHNLQHVVPRYMFSFRYKDIPVPPEDAPPSAAGLS